MGPQLSSRDFWTHLDEGVWGVIPVNCIRRKSGELVMGAGLAKAAAELCKSLPMVFGMQFEEMGPGVHLAQVSTRRAQMRKFISLPTKNHFSEKSSLDFIRPYVEQLAKLDIDRAFVPKIGCGLGGLDWEHEVRPMLFEVLDERFTIPA
jgi:hypothetical protein